MLIVPRPCVICAPLIVHWSDAPAPIRCRTFPADVVFLMIAAGAAVLIRIAAEVLS